MELTRLLAASLLAAAPSTWAADLLCGIHKATDARVCVSRSELRVFGSVVTAPLHKGGSLRVRATLLTLHADCDKETVRIKDRDGVTVADDSIGLSLQIYELAALACTATMPPATGRR